MELNDRTEIVYLTT